MKYNALIYLLAFFVLSLSFLTCTNNSAYKKLEGKWSSKDGITKLHITNKQFTINDGQPVTEDYFVKNDTIFTSYQGGTPYSKFLIKNLDEHKLTLFYPDSDIVEFTR